MNCFQVLTQDQNETHITSTITLTNALPTETGFYNCFNLYYPEITLQQYVYIYSKHLNLFAQIVL